nr:PREDICTED: ent-kaurenoic acid oxidase 1-like [Musa acuminata subsp. malaccensis]
MYKGYMFGSPTIMIHTPEGCRHVLMDDEHFIPGWPKSTRLLMGEKSFVGIVREEHKRLRRLTAAPINGHEALNDYLQFIEHTVVTTLERWAGMGQIEFLTEMRRLTFRIIMQIFLSSGSEDVIRSLEKVYTDLNYGVRAMAINLPGFAFHRALKVSSASTLQSNHLCYRYFECSVNYLFMACLIGVYYKESLLHFRPEKVWLQLFKVWLMKEEH